jgi:hypothetical protein
MRYDASESADPDAELAHPCLRRNVLDEEQAISVAKLNAAVHLAPQDDQLLPQNCILGFEPALRPNGRSQ